jgi:hypothetical protein
LNKITRDFFTQPHPGFKDRVTIDPTNVLGTPVPIVELDLGLDVDRMLEDARKVEIIDHIRAPNPFAKEPRYQGWQLISLWNLYPARKLPHIPSMLTAKFDEAVAPVLPKDHNLLGNIIDEFDRVGLPFRRVIVTVMKPGAYVSPHRDISFSISPLNYVWIPLNYPKGSHFGVFPKGEIPIKLGSVYLLNQENFPHCVANESDELRYVLAGWLDTPYITKDFIDLAEKNIREQYQNNLTN